MYCEKYHCTLSAAACRKRQKMAAQGGGANWIGWHLRGDTGCSDCYQGRAVMAAKPEKEDILMTEETASYGTDAKTATCKNPACSRPNPQPLNAAHFYKNPGYKTGFDGTCRFCRDAAAKKVRQRAARALKAAQPDQNRPETKKPDQTGPKPASRAHAPAPQTESSSGALLSELFAGHPGLRRRVEELAAAELRSIKNQILWMLLQGRADHSCNHLKTADQSDGQ